MEVGNMPIFKSNIAIPPRPKPMNTKGTKKYAWLSDWKVGDCIEVDTEEDCQRIDGAVRAFGFGGVSGKLSRRKIKENGQTFYRVWRVA
tara:strand:+ start:5514 stop:5780 length:267 start_codon:yes stop_codon:yes gene_type:complete